MKCRHNLVKSLNTFQYFVYCVECKEDVTKWWNQVKCLFFQINNEERKIIMESYSHHFKADSSNVDEVWYNEISEQLVVAFKGNRKYRYSGVPVKVYNMMKEAESIGKFINNNIKEIYPTERL